MEPARVEHSSAVITADAFRAAMADLPAAVSIITTTAPSGVPRGATVSAVTSLSKSPPMLLVCLDGASDTLAALDVGRGFLVHVVSDELQDTAMAFATKGATKFDGVNWTTSTAGHPQIAGATTVFDCVVRSMVPGGDHTIVAADILGIEHSDDRPPIVYHRQRMLSTAAWN